MKYFLIFVDESFEQLFNHTKTTGNFSREKKKKDLPAIFSTIVFEM